MLRMLQRLIFVISLITSVGLAQIGAISHEIAHYHELALTQVADSTNVAPKAPEFAQSKANPDLAKHGSVCEKCLSYAEVQHLLQYSAFDLAFADAAQTVNRHSTYFFFSEPRQLYAARAPPSLA